MSVGNTKGVLLGYNWQGNSLKINAVSYFNDLSNYGSMHGNFGQFYYNDNYDDSNIPEDNIGKLINHDLLVNTSNNYNFDLITINCDEESHLNLYAGTQVNINIAGIDELAITASTATFGTNIVIPDSGTIGCVSDTNAISISNNTVTFDTNSIVIPDSGTIGSASDTDAISISAGGVVAISATTASSTTNNGALTVGGGLGVGADINIGDDLSLLSDGSILNFGASRDVKLTHVTNGLLLNGTINKSTSGLIDGVTKSSFTYTNPCGDLTANTNTGDTTVKSFDTTAYELAAISNYVPPTSATHMEITFNFTIYDENISTEFILELLIGSAVADNNIIHADHKHKYKQKYKMESRNQTNEYSKTFHLTLSDLGTNWGSTARNIKFKFTGANSNKIYLFTNSLTSTTDKYTTSNVQYPSISVKSHFY